MKDQEFLKIFRDTKRSAETTKRMTALEEHWSNEAKSNYARAVALANEAAKIAN